MSTLTIRNVEPVLKERLRVRAAQHGSSMEAELRVILKDVLSIEKPSHELSLGEAIHRRFLPLGGVDLEQHPWTPVPDPPNFEE